MAPDSEMSKGTRLPLGSISYCTVKQSVQTFKLKDQLMHWQQAEGIVQRSNTRPVAQPRPKQRGDASHQTSHLWQVLLCGAAESSKQASGPNEG
jgi:hypothetical protein